jgi:hypothetical protein
MIGGNEKVEETKMIGGMHVQPIFNEVYAVLNHRQYLPMITSYELSSIRSLMHVIMSKSM